MNDPKLEQAMKNAAEKDLDENAMKGLEDLSSFKDQPAISEKPTAPTRASIPAVPSIAHVFDRSIEGRAGEITLTEGLVKNLDETLASDMVFLRELVQKININTDQVQALRSHLVRLKLEQAIHSTGVTSNYKSL